MDTEQQRIKLALQNSNSIAKQKLKCKLNDAAYRELLAKLNIKVLF